tara:strand:+ start:262 stop:777 length:516 start_codon:yes stop_codon:yes gene_type:complete
MTFSLLPPITMVITKLIAGNIALSLGMIGALSIVRFRNPVKNPFELVIFFGLVTIGIAMAIDYKYGVGLTIILNSVIVIFKFYENVFKKRGKKVFSFSFEEGNKNNTLIVKSSSRIAVLEDNKNLDNLYFNKIEKIFSYELIFETRIDLDDVKQDIEKLDEIIDFQIKYGN